jgi:hypothetical protein
MNEGTATGNPDERQAVYGYVQCGRVLIIGASLLHVNHSSALPGCRTLPLGKSSNYRMLSLRSGPNVYQSC